MSEVRGGYGAGSEIGGEMAAVLLSAAREARSSAYAPYSGFAVGAALLDTTGAVYRGANVENASFGLSICAETVVMTAAVSAGVRHFSAIAVAGPDDRVRCMPCGRCRQILHEFAPYLEVVVASGDGTPDIIPLASLLPQPFGPTSLPPVVPGKR